MKLLSIRLINFRQHADSSVEFRDGINGILGNNEGGKSTLIEAVSWCLYGADAIRDTMASVRWKRAPAKRQAEAILTFEVAGHAYRIWRSEKDAQLFAGAKTDAMLASGTTAVNNAVPGLLGMRYPEFAASYLCNQRDLNRISAMKPTERMAFVREVLGIGRIDSALEKCRARKNALASELAGAQAGLGERAPIAAEAEQAEQAVTEAESALTRARESAAVAARAASDAAEALSASDLRRRRHEDLSRLQRDAQYHIDQATDELWTLADQLEDAHRARARLLEHEPKLATLPALRAEREELRVAEARQGERRALLGRLQGLTREIQETEALVLEHELTIAEHDAAKLEQLVRDFRAAAARLDELQQRRLTSIGERRSDAARAHEQAESWRAQLAALRKAGPDEPCPVCTRPLGEHYAEVVAVTEGQIELAAAHAAQSRREAEQLAEPDDDELEQSASLEALRSEGEAARRIRDDAARATRDRELALTKLDIARQETSGLEQQLTSLPGLVVDAARLERAGRMIQELETLDRSLAADRQSAGRIQVLLEQRGQWDARRSSAEERAATAQADIDLLHFDADHHAELQDAATRTGEAKETLGRAHVRADEALASARGRLNRAEQALAEYDARAARIRGTAEQHRIHERAADALNRFRVAAAATIRPELEELTSGFVALLTDGRHECVTLAEDFSCTLYESGVPMEIVSGGTDDIAALAMRLAVSQMIAMRAGHPLSLLILDEPFGSLDQVRRGAVLSLIRRLSSVFEQVLLISHIEETRDSVDHAIEVSFDESAGCSLVTQASIPSAAERAEVAA